MRKIAEVTKPIGAKVPIELHRDLDVIATNTGVSAAWHIRKAVSEYIKRNPKLLRKTE